MEFIVLEKKPSQIFSRNLVKIKYIQHIQNDLRGQENRKLSEKIDFLNQAYIFQLIAFWQVFIEDLARYGFKLVENSSSEGIFKDIAEAKLKESLKKFNTPNRENIDKLFKETLGIVKISNQWCSEEFDRNVATATLDELLNARHEIAHTGRSTTKLSYEYNFTKMKILMDIATLTELAIITEFGR